MIDTHCHLTFPDFDDRVGEVLDSARAEGVTGAITVSTTHRDARRALEVARAHENVWCTSGVHPLYSHQGPHDWDEVRLVGREPECVAWGELGLDNHYDEPPKGVQMRTLEAHLAAIESVRPEVDKPVVVHCREAYEELIAVLRRTGLDPARFVFHCFTAGPEEARLVLDFGAMISFTGVVTFKNAEEVREAARLVPRDRIMAETDAPFLTPAPHRKVRPNEPRYAMTTARFLAETRGEAWDVFHEAINRNTERFFGIPRVE